MASGAAFGLRARKRPAPEFGAGGSAQRSRWLLAGGEVVGGACAARERGRRSGRSVARAGSARSMYRRAASLAVAALVTALAVSTLGCGDSGSEDIVVHATMLILVTKDRAPVAGATVTGDACRCSPPTGACVQRTCVPFWQTTGADGRVVSYGSHARTSATPGWRNPDVAHTRRLYAPSACARRCLATNATSIAPGWL